MFVSPHCVSMEIACSPMFPPSIQRQANWHLWIAHTVCALRWTDILSRRGARNPLFWISDLDDGGMQLSHSLYGVWQVVEGRIVMEAFNQMKGYYYSKYLFLNKPTKVLWKSPSCFSVSPVTQHSTICPADTLQGFIELISPIRVNWVLLTKFSLGMRAGD